jgi:lipid-binding SYLF domain-containing protein
MKRFFTSIILLSFIFILAGPAQAGWDPNKTEKATSEQQTLNKEAATTIANFKKKDSGIKRFFDKAYGYAVYPTVGKGGFLFGGAYGKGNVYEKGKLIGTSSLTQVTVGLQAGGQAYSEIIFFKDKKALDNFKSGKLKASAQASAVAVTAGAAAHADYSDGVAIFTLAKGGLMGEASIGGQKFSFTPMK